LSKHKNFRGTLQPHQRHTVW